MPTRRDALEWMAGAPVVASGCQQAEDKSGLAPQEKLGMSTKDPILSRKPLPSFGPWPTVDPFLFCVHHLDAYPRGNGKLGPADSLERRDLGQDFTGRDGWSMYHGQAVPGFPRHPHRGFETITVVRKGLIDHCDSLGAAARYGNGDVQWLTAGDGINHSEMFPLVERQKRNPCDFFQIWLNLPAAQKRVAPRFDMFWANQIPVVSLKDSNGYLVEITVVAGTLGKTTALAAPPDSWASRSNSEVALWIIRMQPDSCWDLPSASQGVHRSVYTVQSAGLTCAGKTIQGREHIQLDPQLPTRFCNGGKTTELLLLQGRPIGEPVARYGPFVMNSSEEISAAIRDYRASEFGGWPWKSAEPTHGPESGRFARYADGRLEEPG